MASHLRSILISLLVAVVTTAAVVIVAYLSFPVTGIRVEGATMYPESDAWDAVSKHASLLTLNDERLERHVESNPWVEGAEVLEDSESGIVTVKVEERRPVLDAEVDGERRTLALDGGELPGLGGVGLNRVELDEDQVGDVLRVGRVLREG
ncbi:MAG: FtsQ-type POTRA domain-containing protein, partial [Actinomycetota bacterium]|nr:FtsQ-type POTRA domain-containing protein [Actinomycetota bacterium]